MSPDLHDEAVPGELPDAAWAERFNEAAREDDADHFDPRDDLARGHARLVRRRVLVGTGSVLVGSLVLGTALLATSGAQVRRTVLEPTTSQAVAPSPTFQEPAVTLEPSPAPDPVGGATGPGEVELPSRGSTKAWRNELFDLTASVIDPDRQFLNYDTDSLQAGTDADGDRSLGIKLGWSQPGQQGEAMVQIELSEQHGPEADESGVYLGAPMRARTLANGETVRVGRGGGGTFAVSYRQPDGDLVWVLVDPLFGNDTEIPVDGLALTEGEVIRLVQDERLDLPPR